LHVHLRQHLQYSALVQVGPLEDLRHRHHLKHMQESLEMRLHPQILELELVLKYQSLYLQFHQHQQDILHLLQNHQDHLPEHLAIHHIHHLEILLGQILMEFLHMQGMWVLPQYQLHLIHHHQQ
jgi:hypothetical protein